MAFWLINVIILAALVGPFAKANEPSRSQRIRSWAERQLANPNIKINFRKIVGNPPSAQAAEPPTIKFLGEGKWEVTRDENGEKQVYQSRLQPIGALRGVVPLRVRSTSCEALRADLECKLRISTMESRLEFSRPGSDKIHSTDLNLSRAGFEFLQKNFPELMEFNSAELLCNSFDWMTPQGIIERIKKSFSSDNSLKIAEAGIVSDLSKRDLDLSLRDQSRIVGPRTCTGTVCSLVDTETIKDPQILINLASDTSSLFIEVEDKPNSSCTVELQSPGFGSLLEQIGPNGRFPPLPGRLSSAEGIREIEARLTPEVIQEYMDTKLNNRSSDLNSASEILTRLRYAELSFFNLVRVGGSGSSGETVEFIVTESFGQEDN